MFVTTSPKIFVVTTISGLSAELALSESLSSLQAARTSETTATRVVAENSIFFIELRNIHNLL